MAYITKTFPLRGAPPIGPVRPESRSQGQTIEALIHNFSSKCRRLNIANPEPVHGSYNKIKAELTWRKKSHTEKVYGLFLKDTGCTGPILNQKRVQKLGIPVHCWHQPVQIFDAARVAIETAGVYCTHPLKMIIGEHEETLAWVLNPLPSDVLGYLPISCLRQHNTDIIWECGTMK